MPFSYKHLRYLDLPISNLSTFREIVVQPRCRSNQKLSRSPKTLSILRSSVLPAKFMYIVYGADAFSEFYLFERLEVLKSARKAVCYDF